MFSRELRLGNGKFIISTCLHGQAHGGVSAHVGCRKLQESVICEPQGHPNGHVDACVDSQEGHMALWNFYTSVWPLNLGFSMFSESQGYSHGLWLPLDFSQSTRALIRPCEWQCGLLAFGGSITQFFSSPCATYQAKWATQVCGIFTRSCTILKWACGLLNLKGGNYSSFLSFYPFITQSLHHKRHISWVSKLFCSAI